MMVDEQMASYSEVQKEALYNEMDVGDFEARLARDSDPTMDLIIASPKEKQTYANIRADRRDLNHGALFWIGGMALIALVGFLGIYSTSTLLLMMGLTGALLLLVGAAIAGLARRVWPASEDLYNDSIQLGLLEADHFPENYIPGMWETVTLQREDIRFWVPVAGVALLACLVIIAGFANTTFNIEVTFPDGAIAVLAVLSGLFALYAIAGFNTAVEQLERGGRILGRLVGQGKLELTTITSAPLEQFETRSEEYDEEEEALKAFEESGQAEPLDSELETPEEEEEPMYTEEEYLHRADPEAEPYPRVAYREPRPSTNRPPVIHKHVPPAAPPQPAAAAPAPAPQPGVAAAQPTYTLVPTAAAPAAPTYLVSLAAPQAAAAPLLALPQDRNAQLLISTQQPYPGQVMAPPAQSAESHYHQEELYRALSYRLQDVHSRLAWLRHRLEAIESQPAPEPTPTPAPAQAVAAPEPQTASLPAAGPALHEGERAQLNLQIRRLEEESRIAREEQLKLVERIRTLQKQGLGSEALKADLEAAQREKERLLARQRRLEAEAEKSRGEVDQTLSQLSAKEREHRLSMQKLLSRMQEAETEKERLAMEREQLLRRPEAPSDFEAQQAQLQKALEEKEGAYNQALQDAETLRQQLAEATAAQVPVSVSEDQPAQRLATGKLERTGLDYQAYITLRDKFILDEVARLAASPLSRVLATRELDNAVVSILEELELSFHTVTAVRKKKSQLKDFYRKPRIEDLALRVDKQLRQIPGLVEDPSQRASLIEAGVNRPFYNSLIESVILDHSPPGTKLKIRRPTQADLEQVSEALELGSLVGHVLANPLHMISAHPGSEEDRFFDLFYLLPKVRKQEVKEALLEAYIESRRKAVLVSLKNLKLWYSGFYVEPERLAEVQTQRRAIEEGLSRLPEPKVESVTTVVGGEAGSNRE